jgi:serine/threonine protein kinase
MPIRTAIEIMLQILRALSIVHSKNILHRDIKPDNIILTPDARAVLIDFGSSRIFDNSYNENHTAIVSPGYAPLEQYSENSAKQPSTDIYAIGATFYQMITGFQPISSPERLQAELPFPHHISSEIDMVLSSIVMLALELKTEDRIQTADEFSEILKRYLTNM